LRVSTSPYRHGSSALISLFHSREVRSQKIATWSIADAHQATDNDEQAR
jgi:hypothetical protein